VFVTQWVLLIICTTRANISKGNTHINSLFNEIYCYRSVFQIYMNVIMWNSNSGFWETKTSTATYKQHVYKIIGFDFWRELGIFLFAAASRTALGSTQPPNQWVPGALSLVVKRPGREADHSPPSIAEVKECVELYLHSPNTSSWLCVQLKNKAQEQLYVYHHLLVL
jgi:hypothetical protein